jgi:hypothetical protein
MALTVFGRNFDISNAAQLRKVENLTLSLHQSLREEYKSVSTRLESLSASSGSMLAHSRSTAERLKDVTMETKALVAEVREMKSMLSEVPSQHSSRSVGHIKEGVKSPKPP